eukprot:COSAG02_NODE_418_length_22698_cov_7.471127_5_plen_564_part_00
MWQVLWDRDGVRGAAWAVLHAQYLHGGAVRRRTMSSSTSAAAATASQTHRRVSCGTAWPYEVLACVPYEDLVAVDDGDAWQQELALKLLEADDADAGKVGCEWSRDSDGIGLCSDVVVRACCGVPVRDLGLCYAPIEQLVCARVASLSAWVTKETGWTQPELMGALAHVRRHAVLCELPAAPMQWVLPPKVLGDALPSASAGLDHFVEQGQLIIRAGSGGLSGSELATRCFGQRSSDDQLLEFGVCVPGNPLDSYVIHDMPRAALAACGGRANGDTSDGNDELQQMELRVVEIAEFAACTIGTVIDNAVLLRDADAIGPSWPGIPGPNLCDLNTIVIARWLTVPRDLLTARLGLGEESKVAMGFNSEQWGTQVSHVMRQPLPVDDELRAWRCLLCVLEDELRARPTVAADQQLLQAGGASMRARERSLVGFRLDKTQLLADAVRTLRECITASVASSAIVIAPEIQSDRVAVRLQLEPGLKELAVGLSEEFVKQAIRMPPSVRLIKSDAPQIHNDNICLPTRGTPVPRHILLGSVCVFGMHALHRFELCCSIQVHVNTTAQVK